MSQGQHKLMFKIKIVQCKPETKEMAKNRKIIDISCSLSQDKWEYETIIIIPKLNTNLNTNCYSSHATSIEIYSRIRCLYTSQRNGVLYTEISERSGKGGIISSLWKKYSTRKHVQTIKVSLLFTKQRMIIIACYTFFCSEEEQTIWYKV